MATLSRIGSLCIAVTVTVAIIVLLALGMWNQRITSRDEAFVEQADRALRAGKAFRARQDSLRGVASAAATQSAAARARAAAGAVESAQLRAQLGSARSAADSLPILVATVHSLEAQVSDWRAAYGALAVARLADSSRADRAEARVATLEPLLQEGRDIVDCHLLGIGFLPRCPSRTVSFVLGVAAGAVGTLVVH